jgi:hypothetical protein
VHVEHDLTLAPTRSPLIRRPHPDTSVETHDRSQVP